jgi:hypothetical protein
MELPSPEAQLEGARDDAAPRMTIEDLDVLVQTAPRAAVIEAWLAVQRELDDLALRAGIDPTSRTWTSVALVRELEKRGVLDALLARLIRDLKEARDVAAHVEPYTVEVEDVSDYVDLARRIASYLSVIADRLPEQVETSQDETDR